MSHCQNEQQTWTEKFENQPVKRKPFIFTPCHRLRFTSVTTRGSVGPVTPGHTELELLVNLMDCDVGDAL